MIRVIDDALSNPDAYRQAALALPFGEFEGFQGIAPCADPTLPALISEAMPGAAAVLSFFRRSPEGQVEPNYIHSDAEMGEWTGILYLNPEPARGDGTIFWKDRHSGKLSGRFDSAEAADLSSWEPWRTIDARYNRLLIFASSLFHSRALPLNYGQGDGARLIQVVFGSGGVI